MQTTKKYPISRRNFIKVSAATTAGVSMFPFGSCNKDNLYEIPAGVNPAIWPEVSKIPFIDTHEHIIDESIRLGNGENFLRADDWTVLFGHYFHHDFVSSGMPMDTYRQLFSSSVDPLKKWGLLEPYWDNVKHTSYGLSVRHTLRLLYGIGEINKESVATLQKRYNELKKPGFYKYVLHDVANIESCQVNTLWDKPINETESPLLLMQDIGISGMFSAFSWSKDVGPQIKLLSGPAKIKVKTLKDWYRVVDWWFEKYGKYAVAAKSVNAYRRNIDYDRVGLSEADSIFSKRVNNTALSEEEEKKLEDHLFWYTTQVAADHGLPIKIHTGYYSGYDYMHLTNVSKNPAYAAEMCLHGRVGGRKFVFLHIAYPYQHEMVAVAKHYSNAYVDLAWAWIIDHTATRQFLKQYLTAAPINKIFCFGGDYIPVELTVGHAYVARLGISQVLTELVDEGYYSEEEAIEVAWKIMYKNAREFYRLDEKEKLLKDVKWGTSDYAKKRENPWKKY